MFLARLGKSGGLSDINKVGEICVEISCFDVHVVQGPSFLCRERDNGTHGCPLHCRRAL